MTDAEIIEGIKSNDKYAFELLYNKHQDYCLRFMDRMLTDHEENEDIYTDALVLFIEKVKRKSLQLTGASIQTYLNSVCRNQVLIRLKHKNRAQLMNSDEEDDYDDKLAEYFDEQAEIKSERIKVIMEELQKMEAKGSVCHYLLRKRYLEGKSMEEIAKLMGYSNVDSAKTQIYHSKELLKKRVFARLKYQCQ